MLPEAAQARKAIWDAVNPRTGKRRIDEAFPLALRANTRNDDMFIRFKNNSTWQVIGSDNFNSLVGSPPRGVVFSEWSLANPAAWTYLRPILRENGGWAVFIWTPRGRNHATRAFEAREKDPTWYTERKPAAIRLNSEEYNDDYFTNFDPMKIDFSMVTPVFSADGLRQELKEMIDEAGSVAEGVARFNQEYLVDFDAPIPGAYFGEAILHAERTGRIGYVPYDPAFPVQSSWDLGVDDYTAIWLWQRVSQRRVNAIGYSEYSGMGFDDGMGGGIVHDTFGNKGGWKFNMHYLPHDVEVRELTAGGRSRRQVLHNLGIRPIRTGRQRDPGERINASRKLFPYVHFDKENCGAGIDHLKQYHRKWNKLTAQFGGPEHDEHSHGADAFGEFAVNAPLPKDVENKPDNKITRPPAFGSKVLLPVKKLLVPGWKVA